MQHQGVLGMPLSSSPLKACRSVSVSHDIKRRSCQAYAQAVFLYADPSTQAVLCTMTRGNSSVPFNSIQFISYRERHIQEILQVSLLSALSTAPLCVLSEGSHKQGFRLLSSL